MQIFIVAAFFGFIFFVIKSNRKKRPPISRPGVEVIENPLNADTQLPIAGAYQKKWLLTYNEKDAFKKIKAVSDEIGCYTFSKVRLLDLLEPVKGNAKYKTYFYKVQAKHVDFVILNEKLVARCIIELDDSSHDTEEQMRRDEFVDEVLKSVGYQIIHTSAVTEEVQQQIREIMKT